MRLLIVGATESGWAAAIQAARMGVKSITIVHDGKWLGGQFTEQSLACIDENKGVGKVGWGVDGTDSNDGKTSILLNYMLGQDYPLERLPKHVADALEATGPGASKMNIVTLTRQQREIVFADAKHQSLALLHHFQNFVHENAPDKTNSFRNFRLSREFGTPDHLPPKPYIRESLRLKALYMMREQDGRNRDGASKDHARERFSHVLYPDGVICWQFHHDFRPDTPSIPEWQRKIDHLLTSEYSSPKLSKPGTNITRGEFCHLRWLDIKSLTPKPFPRLKPNDGNDHGIPDLDDPIPFTAAPPVIWKIEKPTPPPPERDGIPDDPTSAPLHQFNFVGKKSAPVAGFVTDSGLPFDPKRSHGWSRDISANNCTRAVFKNEPRDTFLFTRTTETWECAVPNGLYQLTLCSGDAAHPQPGQKITAENVPIIRDAGTAAGEFVEATAQIAVSDGRLTLILGPQRPNENTCINWLRITSLEK